MFSIELLAWGSLAFSIMAFAVAAVVYLRVSEDCRKIESELEWEKGLRRDLASRLTASEVIVHDLGAAAGFKLVGPGPKVRPNAWEKAL